MLSYRFTSLTGDKSYSFSIRAATNGGIGEYSNITVSTHAGGKIPSRVIVVIYLLYNKFQFVL